MEYGWAPYICKKLGWQKFDDQKLKLTGAGKQYPTHSNCE